MKEDIDFANAARSLIEQTLLNEDDLGLPINGKDIMDAFGLPPGQQVGEALKLAQKLFREEHHNKAALLAALGQTYGKTP